ncbi:uncharacterized protein [Temnothorax nylanderi]|uniref:uncharacterized protein n=1 Tax=Temnothorax nylanderi TaxID=102681 RepID=UPI003A8B0D39
MTWFVVKFDAEDTVEAVPKTWYIKRNSQCYWPPEGTLKSVIIDLIRKKHIPEANWMLYEATILGIYGDYKTAQKKANKARDTNYLSSNNEEIQKIYKRNKNNNRKRRNKSKSEYKCSTDTDKSSLDDVVYPHVPTEQIGSTKRIRVENNTDKRDDNSRAPMSPVTPTVKTCTLPNTSNSTFKQKTTGEQEYQERVLRELHILSLKMDDITETVDVLLKNKANEVQKPSVHNEVPDIINLFPVNEDNLIQLENWLKSSQEHRTILSQNLSHIGGCNVKEIVRRLMYRIFSNEVGMSYSWEGAKKKKVFKNLAIASIILSAVRLNKNAQESTDSEIICFIKAWLVRSKDRYNNNNKNKNPEQLKEIENIEEPTE